jgi:hypothetical protein
MRASIAAALLALAAVLATGCGSQDDSTPVACLDGPGAYLGALGDAPDAVKLSGGVPISDCLAENQKAGDLATVGGALVKAATGLNAKARAQPASAASLQLGYLLGAAQRGADRTEGIHSDLLRRLEIAARYSPEGPLPAAFRAAYREGFGAGRSGG